MLRRLLKRNVSSGIHGIVPFPVNICLFGEKDTVKAKIPQNKFSIGAANELSDYVSKYTRDVNNGLHQNIRFQLEPDKQGQISYTFNHDHQFKEGDELVSMLYYYILIDPTTFNYLHQLRENLIIEFNDVEFFLYK